MREGGKEYEIKKKIQTHLRDGTIDILIKPVCRETWNQSQYQNSGGRSYEVTLKVGGQGYGRSGVTGSVGAYNIGARTRPQLIGCALAQEPGVLNFGLGLQTVEGDEYAETGR